MVEHDAVIARSRQRWDDNAQYWIDVIRNSRDRYRTELTDAALLQTIGECAGLRVLDAGCGEGYLARHLASAGADVLGVDVCRGLVEAAGAADTGARFVRASVDALPIADTTLDLIVCNHLFNDLYAPEEAVGEFGRVLRPGGRVVILTLHPCFYVSGTECGAAAGVPAARYFGLRGIEQHFTVDGCTSPSVITSWLRPLEWYATTLRDSGFVITDLREPHPDPERLREDPWWREGFPTPIFLLLVAERR